MRIEKTIRLMMADGSLEGAVLDVKVPSERVAEVKTDKNGKAVRRERLQRVMPGYILIEMDLPLNWKSPCTQIRKIQGVTGFVGSAPDARPNPITSEEARGLLQRMGEIKGDAAVRPKQSYGVGEQVRIIDGPFESFTGTVEEVYADKSKMKVMVGIFGRNTPVEVEFLQVEKV
jgi:transcriptional antiterminator NusG